jgi:hypothetical protein
LAAKETSPCPEHGTVLVASLKTSIFAFVGSNVSFGLLNIHTIAGWYLETDPFSDVFRCRIDIQNIIQILMIKGIYYNLFDYCKVDHHSIVSLDLFICGLAVRSDYPRVAVKILALTSVRQI